MTQQAFEIDQHGQMIRGTVYRPDRLRRGPAVLLLHGFTGNRIESGFLYVQLGRRLAEAGIAAVTFDFRDSGESDGSFDRMLVTRELDDVLRMTHWLQSQPFADRGRLGLLGFSLGGLLAACAMNRIAGYRALALIAPTTVSNLCRVAGDTGEGKPVNVGPYRLHPEFFHDVRSLNPVSDVIAHPRPTMLIQGLEDTAVPPAVSQAYVDALQRENIPVEHLLIEGANHGFATPATRARLLDALVPWFVGQLE